MGFKNSFVTDIFGRVANKWLPGFKVTIIKSGAELKLINFVNNNDDDKNCAEPKKKQ